MIPGVEKKTTQMTGKSRDAWQALYSKHGIQYGGTGDVGILKTVVGGGALVLDAGCGDGKTTEVLARDFEVVGCDFSREALVSLRTHRDPENRVDLVECELGRLPFHPEKFDAITCVHALSHLTESERIAASAALAGVLKRGGYIFFEVFGTGDLRFGKGKEVEPGSFLRGNGIMTHYFEDGELGRLFSSLDGLAEARSSEIVTYGAVSGRRETIRSLFHKR